MKKSLFMGIAILASVALVGCKSKDSGFRKAYDQATAQELTEQSTNKTATVEQLSQTTNQEAAVQPVTQPVTQDNSDLRSERLNVLNNGTLKAFNIVCGSFQSIDNANKLRNELVSKGYTGAQVAQNAETGMYRVVASSFDDRAAAIDCRNTLRQSYTGAWILLRQY